MNRATRSVVSLLTRTIRPLSLLNMGGGTKGFSMVAAFNDGTVGFLFVFYCRSRTLLKKYIYLYIHTRLCVYVCEFYTLSLRLFQTCNLFGEERRWVTKWTFISVHFYCSIWPEEILGVSSCRKSDFRHSNESTPCLHASRHVHLCIACCRA